MTTALLDEQVKKSVDALLVDGKAITVRAIAAAGVKAGPRQINESLNRLGIDPQARKDLARDSLATQLAERDAVIQELGEAKQHLERQVENLQAQARGEHIPTVVREAPAAPDALIQAIAATQKDLTTVFAQQQQALIAAVQAAAQGQQAASQHQWRSLWLAGALGGGLGALAVGVLLVILIEARSLPRQATVAVPSVRPDHPAPLLQDPMAGASTAASFTVPGPTTTSNSSMPATEVPSVRPDHPESPPQDQTVWVRAESSTASSIVSGSATTSTP